MLESSIYHYRYTDDLISFNNKRFRYIDDLISFNDKRFKKFISDIYPKELTISETTESTSVASDLDLLFTRHKSNNITTKLYDKRDAFGFYTVNFPYVKQYSISTSLGVYASQLIRYTRCCSNCSDFLSRQRALVTILLLQGYNVNRLSNTFNKKFYGRHTDNTRKMSAKHLLILSVEVIFFF